MNICNKIGFKDSYLVKKVAQNFANTFGRIFNLKKWPKNHNFAQSGNTDYVE